ncbi:MAG: hypothetical protein ABIJ48_00875 [Actinomycetota bacterium]
MFFAIDMVWPGLVAKGFCRRQIGLPDAGRRQLAAAVSVTTYTGSPPRSASEKTAQAVAGQAGGPERLIASAMSDRA